MKIGRTNVTELARLDLRSNNGTPIIVGWTADNRAVAYPLALNETADLIKRLASHLAAHHRPVGIDRTAESRGMQRD